MVDKVQMEVPVEVAEVIAKATDLFARLSMGQLVLVAEMVADGGIPAYAENGKQERHASVEVCDAVREKVGSISALLGYHGSGHSLSIGNQHVPIAGHRAWEVTKVLQKVLAEHRNPNPEFRGVNYDGLTLRYTQDPAPTARIVDGAL